MTSWIETTGKTLDDAKQTAANELGVSVDELEVEVLEESSKGFLGFGHHNVRIRAAVPAPGSAEMDDTEMNPEEQPELIENVAGESKSQQVLDMLSSIFAAMGFDVTAKLVSDVDDEIHVEVTGASDDIGRLIGRHGQTLDALQYLIGIAVNRVRNERTRVVIDAEGYRERHRLALETKALDLAKMVKETGNEAVLEPQSARDRRIVHVVLAEDPEVQTYSEGDGEDRHVVISPSK